MKAILEKIALDNTDHLNYLVALVDEIRPASSSKKEDAILSMQGLIDILLAHPELKQGLAAYWFRIIKDRNPMRLLIDLGITPSTGFVVELFKRINHQCLPPVPQINSLDYLLGKVFHQAKDYTWVECIPDAMWQELAMILGMNPLQNLGKDLPVIEFILNAILITSLRICSIGLESEIIERLPQLEKLDSPFLAQNLEVDEFMEHFKAEEDFNGMIEDQDYQQVIILLKQCENYIDLIRKNKNDFGITLHMTFVLLRLTQNIDRLKTLIGLLHKEKDETHFAKEVVFFKNLVKSENKKNSIYIHLKDNFNLLAFQITEHASKTGEHYITSNQKEYWQMLFAAFGGGFVVGFLVIFKLMIYYLKLPFFGTAALYSLNYSFGFIVINLTHCTLATKQPAMTATHIAQSLDDQSNSAKVNLEERYSAFADLTAQICRSQLVALFGNIIIVFPIVYGIAWVSQAIFQKDVIDLHKAEILLMEINPFESYALLHAGIAGIYLFFAGLISGYYDNQSISLKIPKRLKNHPFLRKILPAKVLIRFANYMDHNLGGLMGNFWLGILLGSTGILGMIMGLPLDIRHITFTTGNFGIAMFTLGSHTSWQVIGISVLGIVGIGFMNMAVSFSLALYVAFRSRGLGFKQSRRLLKVVVSYFFKKPLRFIFPPKIKTEAVS